MKDTPTITVPLATAPGAITDSIRAALTAHGYEVVNVIDRPLASVDFEALLVELGRNATQALYCVALERDDDDEG